jgi:hypothetical protein
LISAYDLAVVFRVEVSGKGGGVYKITKQHRELAALGVGEQWGGGRDICLASTGSLGAKRCSWQWSFRGCCGARALGPDQSAPPFIDNLGMGKEDGLSEIRKVVIVNGKLALESTIGDAAMVLQQSDRLAEDLIERHGCPSAYGVPP